MCITFWRTYKNPQKEQIAGKFPNWQQSWRSRPWKVTFFLIHFISSRIISFTKIGKYLHYNWDWNKIFVCFQNCSNLGPQQKSDSGIYNKHDLSFRSHSSVFEGLNDNYSALSKKNTFFRQVWFQNCRARQKKYMTSSKSRPPGRQTTAISSSSSWRTYVKCILEEYF